MSTPDSSISGIYDDRAARYGTHVVTYRDLALSFIMLTGLGLSLGFKVIDLGAGEGDGTALLRALGADILSVDISQAMLDRGVARGTITPGKAVRFDIRTLPLPFENNSFDLAVLRYSVHDIEDTASLFKDIRRIVVPGGKLQLVDMSTEDADALTFYNKLHAAKTRRDRAQCWILSPDEYRRLLQTAGFAVYSELWYRSRVSSLDWLAEDQITPERHEELRKFVQASFLAHPSLRRVFRGQVRRTCFRLEFPVVCLTAESTREGGSS